MESSRQYDYSQGTKPIPWNFIVEKFGLLIVYLSSCTMHIVTYYWNEQTFSLKTDGTWSWAPVPELEPGTGAGAIKNVNLRTILYANKQSNQT